MPGLREIIGQNALKDLIGPKIAFAKTRGIALPHLLFCGEKELGKRTFARAIAEDLGVGFDSTQGESLAKFMDLSGVLTNIQQRQVLSISNVEPSGPQLSIFLLMQSQISE